MTDKLPGEGVEESLLTRIQTLRTENERLRTALLKIEEVATRPGLASDIVAMAVYNLAIEALGNAKAG